MVMAFGCPLVAADNLHPCTAAGKRFLSFLLGWMMSSPTCVPTLFLYVIFFYFNLLF